MNLIPDYNNFYLYITGSNTQSVIKAFESYGWSAHTSKWNNARLSNAWGEMLTMPDEKGVLLSGAVAYEEPYVKEIKNILQSLNASVKWEFYDAEKVLLEEGNF